MSDTERAPTTPLLVLGESRRRDVAARLTKTVEKWLESWRTTKLDATVTAELLPSAELADQLRMPDSATIVSGAVDGVEHLKIVMPDDLFALVLHLPRGSSSVVPARNGIARAAFDEAAQSLCYAIVNGLQHGTWRMDVSAQRVSREQLLETYRYGWCASIGFFGRAEKFDVLMSSTLISWLRPTASKSNAANLSRRRSAIVDESVRLEAVLGEAHVSIGDLTALAVDDVIVLKNEISQPGYLVASSGQRVASITLGRVSGKRAAMITKGP